MDMCLMMAIAYSVIIGVGFRVLWGLGKRRGYSDCLKEMRRIFSSQWLAMTSRDFEYLAGQALRKASREILNEEGESTDGC